MKKLIYTVFAAAVALTSMQAQSATISYFLDQSNALPNGVNYAQVTISDSLTTIGDIDFSVNVLSGAFSTAGTANFGMDKFFFNYDNSLSVSSANIINVDPASWNISENKNAGGGFGKFEFLLAGPGARTETLLFSITGVVGDTISSYAMGKPGKGGSVEFFAAHIAGFNSTGGVTSAQFAGSTPVPVPAALWLFGSGLLGLVGIARRKSK